MKSQSLFRRIAGIGILMGALLSNLQAEVTLEQVREEIRKEMQAASPAVKEPERPIAEPGNWGGFKSGKNGFEIVKTPDASLNFSGYLLLRYINQLPAEQSYTDHQGVSHTIDTRKDFSMPHRVIMGFSGFMFDPKFNYTFNLWTVNATEQVAIFGNLSYLFCKPFNLFAGVGSLPGTRSLTYSHPYWMGSDRVMADEFFRPGFTQGIWAVGELMPGLAYTGMLGNNISTLGINATENSRSFAGAGTLWWMPTTHEFGPKGGFGDFEEHQKLATRFGTSFTHSREDRSTQDINKKTPDATQIHMADSLYLFEPDSIVTGKTVQRATYEMSAVDAGIKFKGLFLGAEYYTRWLSKFNDTTGVRLPVNMIVDSGFYVQTAKMIVPQKSELYGAVSIVDGDESAGYRNSSDYLVGTNYYLFKTRNIRLNAQVNFVTRSPASSNFGYYIGGQTGTIVSAGWSMIF